MASSYSLLFIAVAALSHGADGPPCDDGAFPARWERGGAIIAIDSPLHPHWIATQKGFVGSALPASTGLWGEIGAGLYGVRPLESIATSVPKQIVKALDIFEGGDILLAFGTDNGLQKGAKVFLSTTGPNVTFPLSSLVELVHVGEQHSVARVLPPQGFYSLSMMLNDKSNPVWTTGFTGM
jgi:hypothetical protein